jgi:hypothetical protein
LKRGARGAAPRPPPPRGAATPRRAARSSSGGEGRVQKVAERGVVAAFMVGFGARREGAACAAFC